MVVLWLEWSNRKLTCHENRKGSANQTMVGEIAYACEKWQWRTTATENPVHGTTTSRQEAKKALLKALNAKELS